MERSTIFKQFKTILTEHVAGNETNVLENIGDNTDLSNDLGIESLDVVNIVIDMEDHFHIQIDNDSIRRMSTVGNCVDLIQEMLQAA
jgi:acyl carrier protein